MLDVGYNIMPKMAQGGQPSYIKMCIGKWMTSRLIRNIIFWEKTLYTIFVWTSIHKQ